MSITTTLANTHLFSTSGNFTASTIAPRNNRWLTTNASGEALPKVTFKAEEQIGVIQYYLDSAKIIVKLTNPISIVTTYFPIPKTTTFTHIVVSDSQVK